MLAPDSPINAPTVTSTVITTIKTTIIITNQYHDIHLPNGASNPSHEISLSLQQLEVASVSAEDAVSGHAHSD